MLKKVFVYFFFACITTTLLVLLEHKEIPAFILLLTMVFISTLMVIHKALDFKLSEALLHMVLLQFFLFPIIYMISGLKIYVTMQIFIMFFGFPFIKDVICVVRKQKLLIISFAFYGMYLLLLLVSTAIPSDYHKSNMAIMYQILSVIKPYLVLAFCFGMLNKYGCRVFELLNNLGRWIWCPLLFLAVFQFFSKGAFVSIFPFAYIDETSEGLFPSRALGGFESSAYFASFASFYSIFYFSLALGNKSVFGKELILAGIYLLLVLFAIQRQELAALFFSLSLIITLCHRKYIYWRIGTSSVLIILGVVVFWALFGHATSREFETWGGNAYTAITHPRANLYDGAFGIAKDYFPFGSGFGSYAGAGSTKYNLELFYKMGFAKLWWFGEHKQRYLLDSYWANPIAEAGLIGSFFLLLHYLFFIFSIVRNLVSASGASRCRFLIAAASLLYVLLTSFSSPSFIEPRIILFPFLSIAAAYYFTERKTL